MVYWRVSSGVCSQYAVYWRVSYGVSSTSHPQENIIESLQMPRPTTTKVVSTCQALTTSLMQINIQQTHHTHTSATYFTLTSHLLTDVDKMLTVHWHLTHYKHTSCMPYNSKVCIHLENKETSFQTKASTKVHKQFCTLTEHWTTSTEHRSAWTEYGDVTNKYNMNITEK